MEVLVLSKTWIPVKIIPVFSAIDKVFRDKAKFMSEDFSLFNWNQWVEYSSKNPSKDRINGVSFFINRPYMIIMTTGTAKYKIPRPSRRNVFIRDGFVCQYCGKTFNSTELTIDHVVPKSHGGKTTWENSATSCQKCNNKKSDKSIEKSGMTLINKPRTPSYAELFFKTIKSKKWQHAVGKFI